MTNQLFGRPEADPVGPGQESVWDYPRPPRLETTDRLLRVSFAGQVVAETRRGVRVLETASPPTIYFPREDVRMDLLQRTTRETVCEWKGAAEYFDLVVDGQTSARAGGWITNEIVGPFKGDPGTRGW